METTKKTLNPEKAWRVTAYFMENVGLNRFHGISGTMNISRVDGKNRANEKILFFYKYVSVGKTSGMTKEDFKTSVPASKDYDTAQKARDEELKRRTEK